jgi:hypothetical protein
VVIISVHVSHLQNVSKITRRTIKMNRRVRHFAWIPKFRKRKETIQHGAPELPGSIKSPLTVRGTGSMDGARTEEEDNQPAREGGRSSLSAFEDDNEPCERGSRSGPPAAAIHWVDGFRLRRLVPSTATA